MTKHKKGILAAVLLAAVASAGSIKVWTTGEYITAATINANFAHIHNLMVGGHGPRLVNADVSGSAAISHSKLATPALLPKAWVTVSTVCSSGTCTMADNSGIASVAYVGVTDGGTDVGDYSATFVTPRANANYAVIVSGVLGSGDLFCSNTGRNAGNFLISCYNAAGAPTNGGFSAIVMDSEN